MAIKLQQAIDYSKANPSSDYAKKIGSAIKSGSFDQIAAEQGVDLSWAGRPSAIEKKSTGATPQEQATDTHAQDASFPANSSDSPVSGSAKLVGNIPKSAFNFAAGIVKAPFEVAKEVAQIPGAYKEALDAHEGNVGKTLADTAAAIPQHLDIAYHALVPQFIQHIVKGDFQKAADTVRNDPVGQIAPLILMGKQVAEGLGKGAQYDHAMSAIASPVTKTASYVGKGIANAAAQSLGASTGTGASSVKAAYNAGAEGDQSFTDAMRGDTSPQDVVHEVQNAVQTIADKRRSQYQTDLSNIKSGDQYGHDFSPVQEATDRALSDFGIVKDEKGELSFDDSKFGNVTDQNKVKAIIKDVQNWAENPDKQTTVGLDTLKQRIGNYITPDTKIGAFATSVKTALTSELNNAPGYSKMTSAYAKASDLLDDIKSATGAGGNAKIDTVFTKLRSAMRSDNQLRLEIMKETTQSGGLPDLESKIAGINMQSFVPKGLAQGVDVAAIVGALSHVFNPSILPALAATSPRLVGEFVHGLGIGAKYASPVIDAINSLPDTLTMPMSKVNQMAEEGGMSMGLSTKAVGDTAPQLNPQAVAKNLDDIDFEILGDYLKKPNDLSVHMKADPLITAMGISKLSPALQNRFIKEAMDLYEEATTVTIKAKDLKGDKPPLSAPKKGGKQ